MLTILYWLPTPCTAHLVWFKILTQLVGTQTVIGFDQIRKTKLRASAVERQLLSFQNPQILGAISSG